MQGEIEMYDQEYSFDEEEKLKTCYLCGKFIPKYYKFSYYDLVWKKRKFGNSRAIRNDLGLIFINDTFRIRYFFHKKCKRMFLRCQKLTEQKIRSKQIG